MAESDERPPSSQTGAADPVGPVYGDLSGGALELDGVRFPHCDQRVLHAPGECAYCDMFPKWQELRDMWRVAFTGHPAPTDGVACPADSVRPPDSPADHRRWPGNRAVAPGTATPSPWTYVVEPPRDEIGQPIARYGDASSGMLRRLARGWRRPGRWWP